jgi:N-acetyl-anhydromuramyl-L-alanine amidase AmpD
MTLNIIQMPVPENITFNSNDCTWVVIHKTAGFSTAQDCANYFISGSGGQNVSSHYIVGLDGVVVQCVPENRGAGGNCCTVGNYASYLPYCNGTNDNMNLHTISIEHIDPSTDNSTPCTDAQKQASFELIKDICSRHDIPMRAGDGNGGIIGHNDIDPVNRARCPGNYPWQDLFNYLQGNQSEENMIDLNTPGVSTYFKATNDPEVWQCIYPGHSFAVGHAILDFYRRFGQGLAGVTNLGLPQGNEESVPGKSGVVKQVFERGILYYDPSHMNDSPPGAGSVYTGHIDTSPAPTDLQNQIQVLQNKLNQIKTIAS